MNMNPYDMFMPKIIACRQFRYRKDIDEVGNKVYIIQQLYYFADIAEWRTATEDDSPIVCRTEWDANQTCRRLTKGE